MVAISLRLFLLGFTSVAITVACLVTFVLVNSNGNRTTRIITEASTASVERLAQLVQSQVVERVDERVSHVLEIVYKLARQQVSTLIALNVSDFSVNTSISERFVAKNSLEAFHEASSMQFTQTDGSFIIMIRRNNSFLLYQARADNASDTPTMYAYSMYPDITNNSLGALLSTKPLDPRLRPYYRDAIGNSPNKVKWVNVTYSTTGLTGEAYLYASAPYYPPGFSQPLGTVAVSCGLNWLSTYLANQAQETGSVMFVEDAKGVLYGSSHGDVVSIVPNGTNPFLTAPISAWDSSDARVRAGHAQCVTNSSKELSVDGVVYKCSKTDVEVSGLCLSLVLLTPRSFFFGVVEEAMHSAEVKGSTGKRVTIGLCAVVLLVSLAGSSASTCFVTRPLSGLAKRMQDVAELQLESWVNVSFSAFTELRSIQKQFLAMTARLKEYKAFLPAMFLINNGDSESTPQAQRYAVSDDREDYSNLPHNIRGDRVTPPRPGHYRSSSPQSQTSSSRSSFDPSVEALALRPVSARLGLGITLRNCTCIVVDSNSFHTRLESSPLEELVRLHGLYVDCVVQCIARANGALDGFQGDRLFASWNAFRPLTQHIPAAAQAALEIQHAVRRVNEQLRRINPVANAASPPFTVKVGIVTGQAAAGRMGCETLRAFAVVGRLVGYCFDLAKHARRCRVPIVASRAVFNGTRGLFQMRPVDVVQFEPSGAAEPVYEVQREIRPTDQEWMYALEDQARAQQREVLFTVFESVMQQDFGAAETVLAQKCARESELHGDAAVDPVLLYVLERVRHMQEPGAQFAILLRPL
eukprot:TRINITY_DN8716_c0_g1_i1.p1 TRINITY_DN8716_c0_g1~~TRINITY_DN8716_c0_g1_i1.p1  ORF type:complete len:809 (+),score=122.46 TRINITY_DN8716_c0_g1_i1:34-2460(+)